MKPFRYYFAVVFLSASMNTGCSVSKLLVGQVDPVDEKSNSLKITPVESIDPDWNRIENSDSSLKNDMPDRAWQSTKTASVISLNSACRQKNDTVEGYAEMNLREINADILSPWRNLENKTEREFEFLGFPAYETTAEGLYYNRKRKFQTLIVKTPSCVYDLIFLSPPGSFKQDLSVFQKFRDKLNIK